MARTFTDTASQISFTVTPMADNMVWNKFNLSMDNATIALAAEETAQITLTATELVAEQTPNLGDVETHTIDGVEYSGHHTENYGLPGTVAMTETNAKTILSSSEEVIWASSDAAVASVDRTGLVTGVATGEATVTAIYRGKTVSATVTVS